MSSAILARLLEFLEFPYSSALAFSSGRYIEWVPYWMRAVWPGLLPSVCLLCVCVGHHDGLECGVMDSACFFAYGVGLRQ